MRDRVRVIAVALSAAAGLLPETAYAIDGDPARGKRVFAACILCHSAAPAAHKEGPSLASIWGQKAGTVGGFGKYSAALKSSDVVWTAETLDRWLQGPRALIPGTTMIDILIADPSDRRDLIAYLKDLGSTTTGRGDPPKHAKEAPR